MLVLTGYYLPGQRAGGPVRSISNMVEHLGDEFEFKVVTPDHDFGSGQPYPGIERRTWLPVGKAQVMYLGRDDQGVLAQLLQMETYDVLYLNSFFHPRYTVRPLWSLRRRRGVPRTNVIVAPRGELGVGALRLKGLKKRAFMGASRTIGMYRDVTWHATSPEEERDVRAFAGDAASVAVAPNIATHAFATTPSRRVDEKRAGSLKVVFASRIMRKKNLSAAIRVVGKLHGSITFDVVGPVEDRSYWQQVQQYAKELPGNVAFSYRGEVAAEDMPSVLDAYDAFLLPTLNENYGHAIVEALARGLPAVISDQTPWRDLSDAGAGAALRLTDMDAFVSTLQTYVQMGPEAFERVRAAARRYGQAAILDDAAAAATRDMLLSSVAAGRDTRGR